MSNFRLYEGPLMQPGSCVCGSQAMPMTDMVIDRHGYGRLYLCPICVLQAAHVNGYVGREEHARAVGDLVARIDVLAAELAEAVANRVVSVEALLEQVRAASAVPQTQGVSI